jgi:hypothetical protein
MLLHSGSRSRALITLAALTLSFVFVLVLASRAEAAYLVPNFSLSAAPTQAAGHPKLTVSIDPDAAKADTTGGDDLKNLTIDAPAGLQLNQAAATTKCTEASLTGSGCPTASLVGTLSVKWRNLIGGSVTTSGNAYVMTTPAAANSAQLGFVLKANGYKNLIVRAAISNAVPVSAPTRLTVTSLPRSIQTAIGINLTVTIDQITAVLNAKANASQSGPYFTLNPSSCGVNTTTATLLTYAAATISKLSSYSTTGCPSVLFRPTAAVTPTNSAASGATGFNSTFTVPTADATTQDSSVKSIRVDFPNGVLIDFAQLASRIACNETQLAADTCPASSKVGTSSVNFPSSLPAWTGDFYLTSIGPNFGVAAIVRGANGARATLRGVISLIDANSDGVGDYARLTLDQLPNAAWSSASVNLSATLLRNNCPTGSVNSTITSNSASTAVRSGTWTLAICDPLPQTTITNPPGLYVNNPNLPISFTSNVAGASFLCSWDGAPESPCSSPATPPAPLTQAPHQFCVRAVSGVNQDPTPACVGFTVDTVGPTIIVTSPPVTSAATMVLNYTATDASGPPSCSPASGSTISLATTYTTTPIACVDAAGNASTYSFTVLRDSSPPTISGVTLTPIAPNLARLDYTASDNSGIAPTCTPAAGSSIPLSTGPNTVTVTCVDSVGHVSAATATIVNQDTAAPTISGLASSQGAGGATISYVATDNSGAAPTCTPPSGTTFPFTASGSGVGIVSVVCRDAAGNVATASLNISSDGPGLGLVATVTGGPTGNTTTAAPTFTYSVNRATIGPLPCSAGQACAAVTVPLIAFSCTVDGISVACAAGSYTASSLPLGQHTFCVNARGIYSGELSTPKCRTFTVISGGSPPVVAITFPAGSVGIGVSTINVSYTVNGSPTIPAGATCTVNGVASTNPTTNATALARGSNLIAVTCTNSSGSDTKTSFVQQQEGFGVAITTPLPNSVTSSATVNVMYNQWNNGSGVACTINGAPSTSGSVNPVALPVGTSTIDLVCTSGNDVATSSVTVTRGAAPAVAITAPADGSAGTAETNVSYTVDGLASIPNGVDCRVNGAASTSATTNSLPLEIGATVITASCSNVYGSNMATITVNRANPVPAPELSCSLESGTLTCSWTAPAGLQVRCTLEPQVTEPCISPAVHTNIPPGAHTFELCFRDPALASNCSSYEFEIPNTAAPVVTITSPSNSLITMDSSVPVSYSVSPIDATCNFPSGSIRPLAVGANDLTVTCGNASGDTSSATVRVTRGAPFNPGAFCSASGSAITCNANPSGGFAPYRKSCSIDSSAVTCGVAKTVPAGTHAGLVCAADSFTSSSCIVFDFITTPTPLLISITSPTQNFKTTNPSVVLNYTVSVGGAVCDKANGSVQPLVVGTNTITVTCTDPATGAQGTATVSGQRANPLSLNPGCNIGGPITVPQISCFPSASGGFPPYTYSCTIDGGPTTICGGAIVFSPVVGTHMLNICVTDSTGSTVCATYAFTYTGGGGGGGFPTCPPGMVCTTGTTNSNP